MYKFSYLITAIFLLFFTGIYVFAWAPPTSAPPQGNVSPPLNTSATAQVKTGGIAAGSFLTQGGSTLYGGLTTIAGDITTLAGVIETTSLCLGTDCKTSWPLAGGGSAILRGTQCHVIGQQTCTLTLACPAGESLRSVGWNIEAGTINDPSENEKANASYFALASLKDTDSCVGNNSCTKSAAGTSSSSDLWGVMVGLCSAGTPPSSTLATGLYGWCDEYITPYQSGTNTCTAKSPLTCSGTSCGTCPVGYTRVETGQDSDTISGSGIVTGHRYSCYKD